jgi:hypothetical protein
MLIAVQIIAALALLAYIVIIPLSLISPKLTIPWRKTPTRKWALGFYTISTLCVFLLTGLAGTRLEEAEKAEALARMTPEQRAVIEQAAADAARAKEEADRIAKAESDRIKAEAEATRKAEADARAAAEAERRRIAAEKAAAEEADRRERASQEREAAEAVRRAEEVNRDRYQDRVCAVAIAMQFHQDPRIMTVKRFDDITRVSYRRPSDNSFWDTACRLEGNRVMWASVENNSIRRWRIHPADEILTWEIKNDRFVITLKPGPQGGSGSPVSKDYAMR